MTSKRKQNYHYEHHKNRTDIRKQKRSPAQIRKDRIDVSRLYVQGYSNVYISEWLSNNRDYTLSQGQVYADIKAIEQEWRDRYLPDIDKMKAAELARLDALIQEAWQGWYDSRKDKETSETERTEQNTKVTKAGSVPVPIYEETKSKLKTEGRDGSYKFLELIDKFIARRCKILGLDAPSVHEIKDWRKAAEEAGFNPAKEFESMVNEFVDSEMLEAEEEDDAEKPDTAD